MYSRFGGGVWRCQSPNHMQPRGLLGCETAPPRARPRDETRPSWRKGSLPPSLHRPYIASLIWGGGGREGGARRGKDWVSESLSWTLSPVTAISAPPVTPGLPLGTFRRSEPASAFLVEDPQKPWQCPFDLGLEVWHQEQVGPALPGCFSFSFIINLGHTREFQMTSFLRNFG